MKHRICSRRTNLGSLRPAYIGDAFAQQNTAFNVAAPDGSFAFLTVGSSSNGPIAKTGRFTADGGGNVTNLVEDENNGGGLLPNGTVTGSCTVDTNQFGGGTLTGTDSNIVSDGTFSSQIASRFPQRHWPETTSSAGACSAAARKTSLANFKLTSSGSFGGLMDLNEFTSSKKFLAVPISGSLAINGDGAQANTCSANAQASPASDFKFTVYVANQNTLLLAGADTDRVVAGTMTRQPGRIKLRPLRMKSTWVRASAVRRACRECIWGFRTQSTII